MDEVRAIAERLRGELAANDEVVCAWLFGSVARGEATASSDVDVAVLRRGPLPRTLDELPLDLEDALSRALLRRVDVVDARTAPADLVHRILRDGIRLVDNDPRQRVRFEVAARNRYFDMLPVWRAYRDAG